MRTKVARSWGNLLRKLLRIRLGRFAQFSPLPLLRYRPPLPSSIVTEWPTFTIVTPSFNQGRFIAATVASVMAQGCPRLEYIIQDACSTDDTRQVLSRLSGPKIDIRIGKDAGQADAINRGFAGTDGAIMGYLNSDDLLLPEALRTVADYFLRHPEVDAVYGDRLIIDEFDSVVGYWRLPYHDGWVMRTVDYVPQETLFWRRRAWDAVGGSFDSSLQFAMDWDFLLRLQQVGMRIEHVSAFLGAFRIHSEQKTSSSIDRGRQEMRLLRRRHSSAAALLVAQLRHPWLLVRHVWQDLTNPL